MPPQNPKRVAWHPDGTLRVFAPAKINLYLHVTGRRDDGYHDLDSLAVFASDIHDVLTFRPANAFSLTVDGPFADTAGCNGDNLVGRAYDAYNKHCRLKKEYDVILQKNIPVGAGLGGGSADAAATILALETLNDSVLHTEDRIDVLKTLGADVPVCALSGACRFQGTGERITLLSAALPTFFLVIVWPGVFVSTRDIFTGGHLDFGRDAALPESFNSAQDLAGFLHTARNDMTRAAIHVQPVIAHALSLVESAPGCFLSRMSGSGSAVFGLFETREAAEIAARDIASAHPDWWVKTSGLIS